MDVYEIITQRIMESLENGVVPWHRPWRGGGMPKNLVSKKEYRGINVLLLAIRGYTNPWWLTFKQAQDLGGSVRKGERSSIIIFWKWVEKVDAEDDEEKKFPVLRYYNVFNFAQCKGIENPDKEDVGAEFDPIPECERVVMEMPNRPEIHHNGIAPGYVPRLDTINMPEKEAFKLLEEYFSTLFHELCHGTGHESRLNRKGITDVVPFGKTNYSAEELVAEMGAAFLCGFTGIENKTIDNSSAYIANWLRRLEDDKKFVILAAAQAQKACDFILNRKPVESQCKTNRFGGNVQVVNHESE